MKKSIICIVTLLCVVFVFSQDTEVKEQKESPFKLRASVKIQAQKAFWENGSKDNLDQLYGRVDFGAGVNTEKFSSAFSIRAYPEGFGYEALTGISFDDWAWQLDEEKTSIAKFQITEAWAKFTHSFMAIRVGRFFTNRSVTDYFGNYLDNAAFGDFRQRDAFHNATEFEAKAGPLCASVMLGAGDKNLNRGYLRVLTQLQPIEAFIFSLGYRGNIFDRIRYEDEPIGNRFVVSTSYEIIKGLKPYVEFGVVDEPANRPDLNTSDLYTMWADLWEQGKTDLYFNEWETQYKEKYYSKKFEQEVMPILIGLTIPTGDILDMLAVEVEIIPDRQVNGEDKVVEFALSLEKKLGKRAKFNAVFYSDPAGDSMKQLGMGICFTTLLR